MFVSEGRAQLMAQMSSQSRRAVKKARLGAPLSLRGDWVGRSSNQRSAPESAGNVVQRSASPRRGFLRSERSCCSRPTSLKEVKVEEQTAVVETKDKVGIEGEKFDGRTLKAKALEILSDPVRSEEAAVTFEEKFLQADSAKVKESKLGTLTHLARHAGLVLFPLRIEVLRIVFGAMKAAGYTSGITYISAARVRNSELNYVTDEATRTWLRGAERAMERGIGPARKAAVVYPEEIAARRPQTTQGTKRQGPRDVWASFIVACWWLLRTVEMVALTLGAVFLHEDDLLVEFRLGATKNDIAGRGSRRIHSCCCDGGRKSEETLLCPYHIVLEQVADRIREGAGSGDCLFCAPDGTSATHAGTVAAWQLLIRPEEERDDVGDASCRRITGHGARRTGAQWMIRRGMKRWIIVYYGRWGSEAVLRYIAEAEAAINAKASKVMMKEQVETDDQFKVQVKDKSDVPWWAIKDEIRQLKSTLSGQMSLCDEVKGLVDTLKEEWHKDLKKLSEKQFMAVLEDIEKDEAPVADRKQSVKPFVINRETGAVHLKGVEGDVPSAWKTPCGWNYGVCIFDRAEELPENGRCKGCWPELRKKRADKASRISDDEKVRRLRETSASSVSSTSS